MWLDHGVALEKQGCIVSEEGEGSLGGALPGMKDGGVECVHGEPFGVAANEGAFKGTL